MFNTLISKKNLPTERDYSWICSPISGGKEKRFTGKVP